ncbi:hypothetical protein [Cohnella fermenti]|uniref:Uncharacterized protein n=1 Tax=Cohnella fermenti TaxID=2565925 RepID=A0A4S4BIS2_9BACL|nr:hypothetical protein [Cohnella fermenti]THF73917.1 hypothetical protein E6C55_26980 [Cohnella fermenti]
MMEHDYRSEAKQAIAVITGELNTLRQESERLKERYGEAAATNDLTFIKILEEKYGCLTDEIGRIGAAVSEVEAELEERKEAIGIGGENEASRLSPA